MYPKNLQFRAKYPKNLQFRAKYPKNLKLEECSKNQQSKTVHDVATNLQFREM